MRIVYEPVVVREEGEVRGVPASLVKRGRF